MAIEGEGYGSPAASSEAAAGLGAARDAYRRRDWVAARRGYVAAQVAGRLDADDLYALGMCSWWLGDFDAALRPLQEAFRRHVAGDRPGAAALVALNIGYELWAGGDGAQGSGWISRASRLLEGLPEQVGHGFLAYFGFERAFHGGDLVTALERAQQVYELGSRIGDPTLVALGGLGQGRVLVRRGEVTRGMALLDEAMVAAVSDELAPDWTGNIYCQLMAACEEIADLRRAREWTEATARWCEAMPGGAGPFLGICRVHRAHVMELQGEWETAEREARRVIGELGRVDERTVAEAQYVLGELRRHRGDAAGAEAAYGEAHRLGRDPQPGLALLRLAAGDPEVAATSIRSALARIGDDPLLRWRLLPAAVEVAIAAGDLTDAREVAEELARIAEAYEATGLGAASLYAQGLVLLAEGSPRQALPALHEALARWQEFGAAMEVVRVREALAGAYELLGDRDAAGRERQVATVARDELTGGGSGSPPRGPRGERPGGLTAREAEILALVAAGLTNQQIAAELVLSVRTVERHLATVYQKLGLAGRSARAAAVTFAHREGLLGRP